MLKIALPTYSGTYMHMPLSQLDYQQQRAILLQRKLKRAKNKLHIIGKEQDQYL